MLLGNYTVTNKCPMRFLAGGTASPETGGRASVQRNGSERCRFYIDQNTTAIKTWAEPSANYPPNSYTIIPQRGSWLSSRRETWATVTGQADGLMGMPGEGEALISITVADASGGLITSGEGSASFTVSTNAPLLTASINGGGSAALSVLIADAILGAEASLGGEATFSITVAPANRLPLNDASPLREGSATFSITGSLVPYATGKLEGTTEDTSAMTPNTVARAVWDAALAEFQGAGTTGQALNGAGAAGDPWIADLSSYGPGSAGAIMRDLSAAEIADAVLAEGIAPGTSLAEALRVLMAVAVGKATGGGSGTITFRDLADTKDMVVMAVDADGNRTGVTVNP